MIIAIDGYSACGKSTLAKALGKVLHFAYVDTGAMYRAVTLYFLRHSVDLNDVKQVQDALAHIEIHFERKKSGNHVFLNGEDVESEIRTMYVSDYVSQVAAISEVRRQMAVSYTHLTLPTKP
jgi:cytidylate kinase